MFSSITVLPTETAYLKGNLRWCERGDLNPHALRHRILSPARLPFRHSRLPEKHTGNQSFFEASIIAASNS